MTYQQINRSSHPVQRVPLIDDAPVAIFGQGTLKFNVFPKRSNSRAKPILARYQTIMRRQKNTLVFALKLVARQCHGACSRLNISLVAAQQTASHPLCTSMHLIGGTSSWRAYITLPEREREHFLDVYL